MRPTLNARLYTPSRVLRWATSILVALLLLAPARAAAAGAPAHPATSGLSARAQGSADGHPHPSACAGTRDRLGFLCTGGAIELRAADGPGSWVAEARQLRLTVVPPWWQTWWFNLLVGGMLLASIIGGVSLRLHWEERRRRRLEAEVAARTAALAAANASLERQVRLERTLIMSQDLDALLVGILDQIAEVVPFGSGAIFTLEEERLTLRALRSEGPAPPGHPVQLELGLLAPLGPALAAGAPMVLSSACASGAALGHLGELFGQPVSARTWLVAPLCVQEHLIGVLVLASRLLDAYDDDAIKQLEPFISPVAIALENDRLRQHARSAAMLAERARMARELHDAVTQTLFSASVIAEALPDALQRSPERAALGAAELRRLTAGALAELRALLLELRPKALTEMSLGRLVQLLSASLQSRSAATIAVTIDGDCTLEPAVQLACYRIAQEALNNIVKHAAASHVTVGVDCTPEGVLLQVSDDGSGFTPEKMARSGLGLGIMRERAAEIGAQLAVVSEPDAGTTITLTYRRHHRRTP